jgi:hypothetical protein
MFSGARYEWFPCRNNKGGRLAAFTVFKHLNHIFRYLPSIAVTFISTFSKCTFPFRSNR